MRLSSLTEYQIDIIHIYVCIKYVLICIDVIELEQTVFHQPIVHVRQDRECEKNKQA